MTAMLEVLEGHRVQVLVSTDDQVTLRTDHHWVLAIYNRFTLKSVNGNDLNVASVGGHFVVAANCLDDSASIIFEDGTVLSIDLSDSGYTGPEAMQLSGPEGETIIWN